jgi:hypothetical protein
MQNRIITICSLLTFLIGWSQSNRTGFIAALDNEGTPVYPLSAGSSDAYILALGTD